MSMGAHLHQSARNHAPAAESHTVGLAITRPGGLVDLVRATTADADLD